MAILHEVNRFGNCINYRELRFSLIIFNFWKKSSYFTAIFKESIQTMKKLLAILTFTLVLGHVGFSQHEAQLTQYMFNRLPLNPGYAGATNGICASGSIRQQWVGFKESDGKGASSKVAPETYLISATMPVELLHGGLGISIVQDAIAFQKNTSVNLAYGYQTSLGGADLGLGIQFIFSNRTTDFSKLHPIDGTDPLLSGKAQESDMLIDAGLGAYYRVPDQLFAGISIIPILGSKASPESTSAKLQRQINIIGGYEFPFPGSNLITCHPAVYIRSTGAVSQIDLTGMIRYDNKIWGGLTYRHQDAIALIFGMDIKDFEIGYSYDINTSALRSFGSHEVRIGYCFKIKVDKGQKIYRNTRFL